MKAYIGFSGKGSAWEMQEPNEEIPRTLSAHPKPPNPNSRNLTIEGPY